MTRKLFVWTLVFAAALCLGCKNKADGKADPAQAASRAQLVTADGKKLNLSKLGAPAVLVFYGPEHKASKQALDRIGQITAGSQFKKLKVFAITRGKDKAEKATAKKEFAKEKWRATLAYDPDLGAARAFSVSKPLPVAYILDKNGKLVSQPIRQFSGRIRTLTFEEMLALAAKGKSVPQVDFIPYSTRDEQKIKLVGKRAPAFSITDLNGRPWTQKKLLGKANLILVFWSPGCPHCKVELPRIRKFTTQYAEKYNVETLIVSHGQSKEDENIIRKTMSEIVVDFPSVMSRDGKIQQAYFVDAVPTMFVINKNGVVCEFISGEMGDTVAVLKSIFDDPGRMSMK
jgi:peroxiredoxin